MLHYEDTGAFKRDIKLMHKRNKDMRRLREVMRALMCEETLPPKHRNHRLHGSYEGKQECHIGPNWLLIYKIDESAKKIVFFRTGSHSDLF